MHPCTVDSRDARPLVFLPRGLGMIPRGLGMIPRGLGTRLMGIPTRSSKLDVVDLGMGHCPVVYVASFIL